jgi:hypothetical protein
MSEDFKEEIAIAAEAAAESQVNGMKHHLRQAFYQGIQFEMNRRRKELSNALSQAKADNTPS